MKPDDVPAASSDGGEQSPSLSPQGEGGADVGHPSVPPVLSDDGGYAAWMERFVEARRAAEQAQVDRKFRELTSPERWNQRLLTGIRWKR